MSKERLEELAYNVGVSLDGEKSLMSSDDYDFLYNYALEQAERVQELEELEQEYIELNNDFTKLALENKRYREALEFYADTDNYKLKGRATISSLVFDGGIRARKALEDEE